MVGSREQTIRDAAIKPDADHLFSNELLDEIPESATWVLLGGCTHGGAQFDRERGLLTQQLVRKRGFRGVLLEADFPSLLRAQPFVQGESHDALEAEAALKGLHGFPSWVMRNESIASFLTSMRKHNVELPQEKKLAHSVALYGLDGGCTDSAARHMSTVLTDKAMLRQRALARYLHLKQGSGSAFVGAGADPAEADAHSISLALRDAVENEVKQLLQAAQSSDGQHASFAEETMQELSPHLAPYYEQLFFGDAIPWTSRSELQLRTCRAVANHLGKAGGEGAGATPPRMVVWCHNSVAACNVGGGAGCSLADVLAREYGKEKVYTIGMTTGGGTVATAASYSAPVRCIALAPPHGNSIEAALEEAGVEGPFALNLHNAGEMLRDALQGSRKMRSVGLTYEKPKTPEADAAYMELDITRVFDLLLYFPRTRAVLPLDVTHKDWDAQCVRDDVAMQAAEQVGEGGE